MQRRKLSTVDATQTKWQEAENKAIAFLESRGFEFSGWTEERVEHTQSGYPVVMNSRRRYTLGGSTLRATVGPRVLFVYTLVDIGEEKPKVQPHGRFRTLEVRDFEKVVDRCIRRFVR